MDQFVEFANTYWMYGLAALAAVWVLVGIIVSWVVLRICGDGIPAFKEIPLVLLCVMLWPVLPKLCGNAIIGWTRKERRKVEERMIRLTISISTAIGCRAQQAQNAYALLRRSVIEVLDDPAAVTIPEELRHRLRVTVGELDRLYLFDDVQPFCPLEAIDGALERRVILRTKQAMESLLHLEAVLAQYHPDSKAEKTSEPKNEKGPEPDDESAGTDAQG